MDLPPSMITGMDEAGELQAAWIPFMVWESERYYLN